MSCTKDMLAILMDGIKDADMMLWYSKDAMDNDMPEWSAWFKTKAKQRYEMLMSDYDYVIRAIGLNDRIKDGDDIAMALKEHIDGEIEKIKMKMR